VRPLAGLYIGIIAVASAPLLAAPVASANSMLVQPDGKIVIAGSACTPRCPSFREFGSIVRFNSNGNVDSTFGDAGTVVDFRGPHSFSTATLDSGGAIFVAGASRVESFLPSGQPNPSFGTTGIGTPLEYRPSSTATPHSLVIRADGSPTVAGQLKFNFSGKIFNSRGFVSEYATDGRSSQLIAELRGWPNETSNIADLLPAGQSSVFGVGRVPSYPNREAGFLLRFTNPGSVLKEPPSDPPPSLVAFPEGSSPEAIGEDEGDLIVAGMSGSQLMLGRFEHDGKPVPGFGTEGLVFAHIGDATELDATDLSIAADGSILVAGSTGVGWLTCIQVECGAYVARFDPSGALDTGFAQDGVLHLPPPYGARMNGVIGEGLDYGGPSLAALAAGKLLVGATADGTAIVSRYFAGGSLDPSFGVGGVATTTPCEGIEASLRESGCLSSARVRLRLRGVQEGRPSLRVQISASQELDPINGFRIRMPKAIHSSAKVERLPVRLHSQTVNLKLAGRWISARELGKMLTTRVAFTVPAGWLRTQQHVKRGRKLYFRVGVAFADIGGQRLKVMGR
jgi:uncharacterized delta-60 repeat protein